MTDAKPAVLFYCELHWGYGHWRRSFLICGALARRFNVVMAVTGAPDDLEAPPGVELVRFPAGAHFPCSAYGGERGVPLGGHLTPLLERVRPAAVILEYFPFGRQHSSLYLIPFLRAAREAPGGPLLLSSVRDIQQQAIEDQFRYDKRVVKAVNNFMDGVLVHSDPAFVLLDDTFALARELRVPVYYTGYVAPGAAPPPEDGPRERLIVVSAGGGRAELPLLRAAVEAQRLAAHSWGFRMRVIAGRFMDEDDWGALCEAARGVPGLEVVRWVPDLSRELARASVSVSRCGYNTALNLINSGTPSLVIPFVLPEEDEQTYRSEKLEKLGVLRVLPQERLSPEALAEEIRETARRRPSRLSLDCGGAEETARLLDELIPRRAAARQTAGGGD